MRKVEKLAAVIVLILLALFMDMFIRRMRFMTG